MVTRTIQLILAPVLIISACAITVGGLLGHYAAISGRLRELTRERLEQLREDSAHPYTPGYTREHLGEIDAQLPDLLRRLRLVHDALLCAYSGVAVLVMDMFVIALAVVTGSRGAATLALGSFLLGTTGLFLCALLAIAEVRTSHVAVGDAARRVAAIGTFEVTGEREEVHP